MSEFHISVIVPIYNCCAYLEKCLASIAAQTMANFEVILIDDGSSDGSSEIAQKFAQENPSWQYIWQANGGVAVARNQGLARATGEYIAFVDADDHIDKCMLQEMYTAAQTEQADMVLCNYCEEKDGVCSKPMLTFAKEIFEDVDEILLQCIAPKYALWGRVIKRCIINHCQFLNKNGEELAFFLQFLLSIKRVSVVNKPFYYYVQQPNSLMHRKDNEVPEFTMMEAIVQRVFPVWQAQKMETKLFNFAFLMAYAGMLYTPSVANGEKAFYRRQVTCMKTWSGFEIFCYQLLKTNELNLLYQSKAMGCKFYYLSKVTFALLARNLDNWAIKVMQMTVWWIKRKRGG